jgi:hypothetical protein
MENHEPFSQEILNEIFKISFIKPDRVISRECGWLEFKESFGWASVPKYLRSLAAFANAKGGYIVFGIANNPHILKGLQGSNLQSFEDLDPEKMTNSLNEHFSPEIEWDVHQYELHGKTYGIFYVFESKNKPVVCRKDSGKELKEGDIYYRYRGRSERIKYSELHTILEQRREQEQRLWMRHVENIARIGVRESGIFDLKTGQVTGSGGSFLIDESMLSQLSFIKEGEFSEVKGKPALKLIGDLQAINSLPTAIVRKQIIKTKGIRIGDIVIGFLNQEPITEPLEFLKQICFEATAFLPCYYYIHKSGLSNNEIIEILSSVVSRSSSKNKLITRIKDKTTQELKPSSSDKPGIKIKREYMNQLIKNCVDSSITEKNLEYCLQAIRTLTIEEVKTHSIYLCGLLKQWFNKYYSSSRGSLADNMRRAICWVDEVMYKKP